jgi:hypothetical protein
MKQKSRSLDAILESCKADVETMPREECTTLTLWVPKSVKAKYDHLQARTALGFGKTLKEVVESSIEKKAAEAS